MKNIYKFCLYFLLILGFGLIWDAEGINRPEIEPNPINSGFQKSKADPLKLEIPPHKLSS